MNEKEIKRKKKELNRYRKNRSCVSRLEEKLYIIDQKIQAIRSPNITDEPKGGTPVTIDDLLEDKIVCENSIKYLNENGKKIKSNIMYCINKIEDVRYCNVLEAYYIDCMSLNAIADTEGYTSRHVYRLYTEAIKAVSLDDLLSD